MVETAESRLITAIQDRDADATLKLLKEAGGACEARDLTKLAHGSQNWFSRVYGAVESSIHEDGDKETLTLNDDFWGIHKVASLTQKKCERIPKLTPASPPNPPRPR
jgi:hypothetical protein